jgi:ATP-dependent DNA ligase
LSGLPKALAPRRLILDGEVVAFDDHGRPSCRSRPDRRGRRRRR